MKFLKAWFLCLHFGIDNSIISILNMKTRLKKKKNTQHVKTFLQHLLSVALRTWTCVRLSQTGRVFVKLRLSCIAAYVGFRSNIIDLKSYRWHFPLHGMSHSLHRSCPASQHPAAPVSCAGYPLSAAHSSPQPQAPDTHYRTNKAPPHVFKQHCKLRSQKTHAF